MSKEKKPFEVIEGGKKKDKNGKSKRPELDVLDGGKERERNEYEILAGPAIKELSGLEENPLRDMTIYIQVRRKRREAMLQIDMSSNEKVINVENRGAGHFLVEGKCRVLNPKSDEEREIYDFSANLVIKEEGDEGECSGKFRTNLPLKEI